MPLRRASPRYHSAGTTETLSFRTGLRGPQPAPSQALHLAEGTVSTSLKVCPSPGCLRSSGDVAAF